MSVINLGTSYSSHYLLLLSKYNDGRLSTEKFNRLSLTLLLWQEQAEINSGCDFNV